MTVKLSPSRMNLYFECERCFWLRVNKRVERPSGPFPSLPSGVDEILKQHFDSFREDGEVPPEIEGEGLRLYPDRDFLEKARSWRTEPKWEDPETGALLRGGVDDLLLKDGKIVVLDYKTRGYPPKEDKGVPEYYERQVNLYNVILRENGYNTQDFGYILYYYPDRVTGSGDFLFHSELREVPVDVEESKNWVRDAVETLEGEPPKHSEDCDYSEWKPRGY